MSSILGSMLVDGRPNKAPRTACKNGTNIVPGHGVTPSLLPVPYIVNISNIPTSGYIPRQNYTSKCYPVFT